MGGEDGASYSSHLSGRFGRWARRDRARTISEVRTRVSLRRRMRERAAPPLPRPCAASARSARAPATSTSGAAGVYHAHGVGRARRDRARRTGEVRTRASRWCRMRERATPPLLRACAATATRVRAPAKSTRGAAFARHGHGSRADAAWPGAENRRDANARFASLSNARMRRARYALAQSRRETSGAGEEHERRRASDLNSRTGVGRARRDNSQDSRRAQDPRRRAAAEADTMPAVRLSLHVDALLPLFCGRHLGGRQRAAQ
jgi:hypothetical protein